MIVSSVWKYLLPEVQLADEQIEQIKVAAVEEQVDEAQHGRGAHHRACQVSEPHHGLDDSHGDKVEAWQSGDHWIPLCKKIKTMLKGHSTNLTQRKAY